MYSRIWKGTFNSTLQGADASRGPFEARLCHEIRYLISVGTVARRLTGDCYIHQRRSRFPALTVVPSSADGYFGRLFLPALTVVPSSARHRLCRGIRKCRLCCALESGIVSPHARGVISSLARFAGIVPWKGSWFNPPWRGVWPGCATEQRRLLCHGITSPV